MGTVTVALTKVYSTGDRKEVIGTITPSSSYATNGETCTAAALGLGDDLTSVDLEQLSDRIGVYDYTNNKLLIYTALGTEAVNATNQSTKVFRFLAKGKGNATA